MTTVALHRALVIATMREIVFTIIWIRNLPDSHPPCVENRLGNSTTTPLSLVRALRRFIVLLPDPLNDFELQ